MITLMTVVYNVLCFFRAADGVIVPSENPKQLVSGLPCLVIARAYS